MPANQQEATAHHEAAHAVIAHILGLGFRYVTIQPTPGTLGHLRHWGPRDYENLRDSTMEKHILCAYAGPFAEKRFRGRWNHLGLRDLPNPIGDRLHIIGQCHRPVPLAGLLVCY